MKRADMVVVLQGMAHHLGGHHTKRFAKRHERRCSLRGSSWIQTVGQRAMTLHIRSAATASQQGSPADHRCSPARYSRIRPSTTQYVDSR